MIDETGAHADSVDSQSQQAIQQLLYTHSRGLDRLDVELLKSCYWPQAEVDYGQYKGSAQVFSELVVAALPEQYELTQHRVANTLVAINGAIARVESYVNAYHLLLGAQEEMVFTGRYLDKLERRGDCWKILHRTVVMDWSRRHRISDERSGDAFEALQKGAHGEQDPLAAFLRD